MLKKLVKLSSRLKYSNPYWEYRLDKYKLPSGESGDYHYVNSRGSTIIIPKADINNFILIRQFRYLNQRISIEFPGGGVKPGVEPVDNARKELREETGFDARTMTFIGEYNPFNGVTNEICKVYLAGSLIRCEARHDSSEEFEILEMTSNQIIEKIYKGEIWDGMTLAAWPLYYFSKHNQDF